MAPRGYELLPTSAWGTPKPTTIPAKKMVLVASAVWTCVFIVGWFLYPSEPPIIPGFTPVLSRLPENLTIASIPIEGQRDETGRIQKHLGEIAESRYNVDTKPGSDKIFFERLAKFAEDYMPPSLKDSMLDSIALRLPPKLNDLMDPSDSSRSPLLKPMVEFRNIFQTDKKPPGRMSEDWALMNSLDGWSLNFYNDSRAEKWIDKTFDEPEDVRGIKWAYHSMHRGVLKADFLRYLLPLVKGGVYVDTDTRPRQPINAWGTVDTEFWNISETDGQDWQSTLQPLPAMVIGIEIDIHERLDWYNPRDQWEQPLGICQWALSSAPYHPILQEVTRRIVNSSQVVDDTGENIKVLKWTGPGAFTDAVMSYLLARYNVPWNHLRGRRRPVRIGEVMILPVAGFSPGGPKDFGAEGRDSPQCALVHMFKGSWKGDGV